jgi:hypothetical protein
MILAFVSTAAAVAPFEETPVATGPRACDAVTDGFTEGPIVAGFQEGDLGRARRACTRTEASVSGTGYVIADTANFYGHIVAGGHVDGSLAITRHTELRLEIEAVRWDDVITPIASDWLGFGHTTLGVSQVLLERPTAALTLTGDVVFPTAFGLYENAHPFGIDLGVAGVWDVARPLRLHAAVSGLGSAAISHGPAFPQGGVDVTAGAEWRPAKAFGLVADVQSGFAYTAPVDVVAAGLGLRFGVKQVGISLEGMVPLAGRERALASAELRVAGRFGR